MYRTDADTHTHTHTHTHIYIYIHTHTHIYIYMYICRANLWHRVVYQLSPYSSLSFYTHMHTHRVHYLPPPHLMHLPLNICTKLSLYDCHLKFLHSIKKLTKYTNKTQTLWAMCETMMYGSCWHLQYTKPLPTKPCVCFTSPHVFTSLTNTYFSLTFLVQNLVTDIQITLF